MSTNTAISELKKQEASSVMPGFQSTDSYALLQRVAQSFAKSTFVPEAYRGDMGLPNCIIAVEMAIRANASPLMVMQNLYVIEGRPSWSAQWVIAAINRCGRFTPLRFEITELGEKTFQYDVSYWENKVKKYKTETITIIDYQSIAWAIERETGERIESPPVTLEMAVKEGWYGKNGSKWKTMPQVMLRYRPATFFGRLYAPEILMGLSTDDEVYDIVDIDADGNVLGQEKTSVKNLRKARKTITIEEVTQDDELPQSPAIKPEVTTQSAAPVEAKEAIVAETTTIEIDEIDLDILAQARAFYKN